MVVLGANIQKHNSVSMVECLSKPLFWRFLQSSFVLIPLTSLYNGEAGIVWHTIAHCHTVTAGVVPNALASKLAPKCINYKVLLTTILYTEQ